MKKVLEVVSVAGRIFREGLVRARDAGGFTVDQYQRYLSMQYHLTNGVQRHFLELAAHPVMRRRRSLREFLVHFAWEEEMHYEIARRDLEKLGLALLPKPLDVELWWLHFDRALQPQPFARLGATCILENLGSAGGDVARELLEKAPFLDKTNTRFLQIHMHEQLPHGEQILSALEKADLDDAEEADLCDGARKGAILYLRLQRWALGYDDLAASLEGDPHA